MGIAKGERFVGGEWQEMEGTVYKGSWARRNNGGPLPPLTGMEMGKMWGVTWNARVALATIKMLKCWRHVCMNKRLMRMRLEALWARLRRLRKKRESVKKDLKKEKTKDKKALGSGSASGSGSAKKPVVLKKTDDEKEDMDLEGEEAVDLDDDFDELLSEVEAHTGAGQEDLLETEELWGGGFAC